MNELKLIVNAGGESRRMGGRTKALLPIPPGDTPLIVHMIQRLQALPINEAIVVANDVAIRNTINQYSPGFQKLQIRVVPDKWAGTGAIGGVATGLSHCSQWALVVACDLPYVDADVFSILIEHAQEVTEQGRRRWDLIIPRTHGFPQMMHALYHVAAQSVLKQQIERRNLKLLDVLPKCRVCYVEDKEIREVDPELRSLVNVNTPEDWARVLEEISAT